MKPFRTTALFLLGTVAWTAATVHAQVKPETTPLPPVDAAASSGVLPAGYYSDPGGAPAPMPAPIPAAESEPRSDLDEALHAPCCGDCDECCQGCNRKWFALGSGLVMTRNRAPAIVTTTTVNDPFNLQMNTESAHAGWAAGGQVTLGYAWHGVGGPSMAFTYWGLGPMSGYANVADQTGSSATALNSTLNFSSGTLINGNPASLYFNNAQEQSLWRQDRADNIEFNFNSGTYRGRNLQLTGLAGFRYFRFNEDLTYGSASFGNSFTSNGGADAAYLNIRTHNNLYGIQVGSVLSSIVTERLTVFAVAKVGVYGNQMNNFSQLYAGNTPSTPAAVSQQTKSDISTLSELDAGFLWAFHRDWGLTAGYRVVSVSNLSLADNQFGSYGLLEQSGSLILHGAFLGLTWLF